MVEIYPKLTPTKLKKSARKTSEGNGLAPLPGVRTDAKLAATADPEESEVSLSWLQASRSQGISEEPTASRADRQGDERAQEQR